MVTVAVTPDVREEDGEGGRLLPPTVKELFVGFFVLGVTGFGGVLPLAREALVVRRRWMSDSEFLDLLGLCQLLPGGNIINLAFAIGMHFRGVGGAIAAFAGLLAVPSGIVILLGAAYAQVRHDPLVQHMMAGLAAAAAGLLFAMTLQLGAQLMRDVRALMVVVAAFVAIALVRFPLLPTVVILLGLSILITARRRA